MTVPHKSLSPEAVFDLTYPDFVALLGQSNTPPGDLAAVGHWLREGGIGWQSRVLDLACSTGFSSRTVSLRTGADCVGIDLSAASIEWANTEAQRCGIRRLRYLVGDAAKLPFCSGGFSHVLAGSCFGFIHERDLALAETARVLEKGGRLCISTYHYTRPPPPQLLEEFAGWVGFLPNERQDLDYWLRFFAQHFRERSRIHLSQESPPPDELERAVRMQIVRPGTPLEQQPENVKQACFERLLQTRRCIAEHQKYQGLIVMVFEK